MDVFKGEKVESRMICLAICFVVEEKRGYQNEVKLQAETELGNQT